MIKVGPDQIDKPTGTTTYTYDPLDRLTGVVDSASASTSYGYDAAGNRTSITTGGSTITSTFDALNRLLSDTSGATYTYDANGNQQTKSAGGVTTTYTYDSLDRMTGLSGGPHSAVYTYNGDGLRVSKAVDGAAAVYQTWAGLGQPRVIRDGTTDYLWSGEVIAQVAMGGTAQYAQGDGLGSMRQVTDNTGHVVGAQQYDAYGQPQQQTGVQALPVPGWSIGFTGQQMDAESGLVYLRARYYNPDSGRMLSQDAVGAPGNYVYASNNPQRWFDPSGNQACGLSGVVDITSNCGAGGSSPGATVASIFALILAAVTGNAAGNAISEARLSPEEARQRIGNYRGHLTDRDLEGARIDALGGVSGRKPTGEAYQHLKEVAEAVAGLSKLREQVQKRVDYLRGLGRERENADQLAEDFEDVLEEIDAEIERVSKALE